MAESESAVTPTTSYISAFSSYVDNLREASKEKITTILASRLALRVVPRLYRKTNSLPTNRHDVLSAGSRSFLRGIFCILVARSIFLASDPALAAARKYAREKARDGIRFELFDDLDSTAASAFHTAVVAMDGAAMEAAQSASSSIVLGNRDFWPELNHDIEHVDKFGIDTVNSQPLWHSAPGWFLPSIASLKELLNSEKLASEGFPIWLEWYEAILDGRPAFGLGDRMSAEALERAMALGGKDGTFHEKFWDREPHEINREIAEWVAEARAAEAFELGARAAIGDDIELPQQSLNATMFGLNKEGKIARIAVPPEQRLLVTPQQLLEYQALREDATELAGRGQVLGSLISEVGALLEALPADMNHARVFDVWRALNRLRRTMNAHTRVVVLPEPHEAKLEPAIAENLDALLRTANIFAFGDPGLLRRNEQAITPQDRPAVQEEKRLGDAVADSALQTPDIFTEDAFKSVADEETNAASAGDDAHGQQAIDQTNKTRRNWIAAMISVFKGESGSAWKEMRAGAYKKIGEAGIVGVGVAISDAAGLTSIYPAVWGFVAKQGNNLLNYVKAVYNNPTLTAYIQNVLQALGL